MKRVYTIKLSNGTIFQACGEEELNLKPNDECVVRRDFYMDMGRIIQVGETVEEGENIDLEQVVRIADDQDRANAELNQEKNIQAFRTAKQMVLRLDLPMKLLNAHYSMDGKMLLIQFTADGRVDFRELVKELSHVLGCRLELRQIGVRDETSICGGIAVCGQVLCCSRFLREFNSINVKMAKDQDLSLTPTTISGVCGRLKCCLKFEHEGYVEMEKSMPRRGELCECEKGKGRVSDRNMLTQMVTLSLEDGGSVTLHASELKYRLRGKAPEPKKVVKEEAPAEEFSYFAAVNPAPAAPAEEKSNQQSADNENRNNKRRNNNRRNNKRRNNNRHDNSGQRNSGE